MKMNIEVLNTEMIEVVKVKGKKFNGKGFSGGWTLYIDGIGYIAFEGEDVPYVLDGKKYMKAVRDAWGFDWDYKIIQED